MKSLDREYRETLRRARTHMKLMIASLEHAGWLRGYADRGRIERGDRRKRPSTKH